MATAPSLVLSFSVLRTVLVFSDTRERGERIVSNGKERERETDRHIDTEENGQLLLFDGQSRDDKDYAIVFSQMF